MNQNKLPRQLRESDQANLYLDAEGLVLPLRGNPYRPQLNRGQYKPPARCEDCRYLRSCKSLNRQNLPVLCENTARLVVSGAGRKTIILTV